MDGGASDGTNAFLAGDTVAETGGGIPNDAVVEGELAPGELGDGADQAVEALDRSGWTRPAEGGDKAREAVEESEAHPS